MPRTKSYSLHSQYIGCMHVHWTYAYNCHRVYACALDYTGSCRSSESRGPRHSLILARAPTRREASFASFSRPLNVMTRHEVVVTLLPRPGGPRRSLENRHPEGVENRVSPRSGVGGGCCLLSVAQPPYGAPDDPAAAESPVGDGPLQPDPKRRGARQFLRPAACGELQTTGKPRTVGRVSSGQFARSLRRSRVRAQYRARAARPQVVAAGV